MARWGASGTGALAAVSATAGISEAMDRPKAATNKCISSPDATAAKIGRSCPQGNVPACVLLAHPPLLRPDDVTHRGLHEQSRQETSGLGNNPAESRGA